MLDMATFCDVSEASFFGFLPLVVDLGHVISLLAARLLLVTFSWRWARSGLSEMVVIREKNIGSEVRTGAFLLIC